MNPTVGKKPEGAKKPEFEQSLGRLEEIVRKLESANLPLDDAMKLFEEGMQLSRDCQKQLEQAEARVEILLKKAGGEIVAERDVALHPGHGEGIDAGALEALFEEAAGAYSHPDVVTLVLHGRGQIVDMPLSAAPIGLGDDIEYFFSLSGHCGDLKNWLFVVV